MSIEIRHPVSAEDYAAAVDVASTAFLERADTAKAAAQLPRHWPAERSWVAWDGPSACGTFLSAATELTLPGGASLPAAAVSAVTVLPTHRRRGILTRMAETAHRSIVDEGEPLAVLMASEYPIYGRFGYAPATRSAWLAIHARETSVLGEATGSTELAPLNETTRDAARAVYEVARHRVAGEVWRDDITWDIDTGLEFDAFEGSRWTGFIALHRDGAGSIDGYARYRTEPKWGRGPAGEIEVRDLHAISDAAYQDLWRLLLSVDLVALVKAPNRPVEEPLPWLLSNPRAVDVERLRDRLWVRIFDLPRALEARAYERTESLVLEVVDDAAWGGTRRWRLEAGPDGARCTPTSAAADLTVPITALGAAYLGGARLRDVVRATGGEEHREGALAEADSLFRTADVAWCSTPF
jgi:predicted acetyltransferase